MDVHRCEAPAIHNAVAVGAYGNTPNGFPEAGLLAAAWIDTRRPPFSGALKKLQRTGRCLYMRAYWIPDDPGMTR